MTTLVDSSFLYSIVAKDDRNHKAALTHLNQYSGLYFVPAVTLVEVTHVLNHRIGHHAISEFLNLFRQLKIPLVPLVGADIDRAVEIMETYADAQLDFVDCAIMALSERLNITRVCTFDRRDYLELLPKE